VTSTTADETEILRRCAAFVYDEAERLDSADLDGWLDLFDDECVYWLPMRPDDGEAADQLNLIYDDRARLEDRVSRLRSGFSFSEEPRSRTSHLVSNLRLVGADAAARIVGAGVMSGDDIAVMARFTISRSRPGDVERFDGRVVWVLRPYPSGLKIRVKRVDLVNADQPLPLLTFLL
jgi:benzoate/toluate 1,2-dioxygenase beta subunit